MRISDIAAMAMAAGLVSACSSAEKEAAQTVECRIAGAGGFAQGCSLHWNEHASADARLLVIHHPEGGFRRLLVSPDGKRINVADGAELPQVTMRGDVAEISVGGDAYRVPVAALRQAR